ncbi:hypothetical protein HC251_11585 [Iamia sp. SCSIO 61187]|uniref:glycosyltransferase family 39 protein n=1 Tax=Iamia sp. SCSIO 61187 TaxID=2722752 RepID=UPI001C62D5B1|nr:glycosyltransferase family 39 protein [Iamia sp. SCSIO 61187]QYG93010.1 hypothetical protein HC251_11585 [Iamia sp. SCSIO 61187]
MTPGGPPGRVRDLVGRVHDGVGRDRSGTVILAAAAVGLVVRLVVAVVWARWPAGLYDPARYVGYAQSIADGKGMIDPFTHNPTAYFPPGYPYLVGAALALCQAIGAEGSLPEVLGSGQAVVGGLTVLMVGVLGRRIAGGPAGAAAAVVVALLPNLVVHAAVVLSETVSIALMLAFLLVAVPAAGGTLGRGRLVGAGLLFGAILLVRPVIAGVLVAVVVVWALDRSGWRTVLTRTGAVVGVGLLCVAPWTIRNAVRLDGFVPLSTNTGDNLCIGHAPGSVGAFRFLEACAVDVDITDGPRGEVEGDAAKRDLAIEYALDRWRDQPGLALDRMRYTLRDDHDAIVAVESYREDSWMGERTRTLLYDVSDGLWAVIGVVGLVGLVRLVWRRDRDGVALAVTTAAVLAVPLLTFGDARFKVPVVPLLVIAAAALVSDGIGRLRPEGRRRTARPGPPRSPRA